MSQPCVLSDEDVLKWILAKFSLRLCMYGASGDLIQYHEGTTGNNDDMMVSVQGIWALVGACSE